MRKARATKSESAKKRLQVETLMIQGWADIEIVNHLMPLWDCSSMGVRRYIKEIERYWSTLQVSNPYALKNKYLKRLEALYKQALESGSLKVALAVQQELNRVTGMYLDTNDNERPVEIITISQRDQSAIAALPESEVIEDAEREPDT